MGICQMHEAKRTSNGLRYEVGQKRCTFCGIFISSSDARCPCCKQSCEQNQEAKGFLDEFVENKIEF